MSEPRFPVSWYEMPRSARWAMWREWLRGRLRWEHHESWFAYRHGIERELDRARWERVFVPLILDFSEKADARMRRIVAPASRPTGRISTHYPITRFTEKPND